MFMFANQIRLYDCFFLILYTFISRFVIIIIIQNDKIVGTS